MSGRIYDSARWKSLRKAKLAAQPLCEECLPGGRVRPAMAVDHVIPVRLGGEPFPALDELRSLCFRCHNRKTSRGVEAGAARTDKPLPGCDASGRPTDPAHPWNAPARPQGSLARPLGLRRSAIPLTIVCGPSGAGKTTWVRERAGVGDVVLDLDDIMQEVSGLKRYGARRWHLEDALRLRNMRLAALAIDNRHDRAWFIVGAPTAEERLWWSGQLGGVCVLLATPLEECVRRIRLDPERAGGVANMVRAAEKWWSEYTPDHIAM